MTVDRAILLQIVMVTIFSVTISILRFIYATSVRANLVYMQLCVMQQAYIQ